MWMPAKLLSAKQSATEPVESEQEGSYFVRSFLRTFRKEMAAEESSV